MRKTLLSCIGLLAVALTARAETVTGKTSCSHYGVTTEDMANGMVTSSKPYFTIYVEQGEGSKAPKGSKGGYGNSPTLFLFEGNQVRVVNNYPDDITIKCIKINGLGYSTSDGWFWKYGYASSGSLSILKNYYGYNDEGKYVGTPGEWDGATNNYVWCQWDPAEGENPAEVVIRPQAYLRNGTPTEWPPVLSYQDGSIRIQKEIEVEYEKQAVAVESVAINPSSVVMEKGETMVLTEVFQPVLSDDWGSDWSTSDSNVATISNYSGTLTAKGTGECVITLTHRATGLTGTCNVKVVVMPTEVTLDRTEAAMIKGETLQLVATLLPADADDTLVWTSTDETVATVDAQGNVTALKTGATTVTVTDIKGHTATCEVTVTNPVTAVTLDRTEVAMIKGETLKLTATVTPTDADDTAVAWTTSDEAVATVDEDGNLTAVATGTATVTVTDAEGHTAICAVSVTNPVTAVTLDRTEVAMIKGETLKLTATVTPTDADDTAVAWTTSDEAVATVDDEGNVTAVATGTATVTVTDAEGHTVTCAVTVTNPVIAVTLDRTEAAMLRDETLRLTATVTPEDADDVSVTWSSDNEDVASVDAEGLVTALSTGSAVITAADAEGHTATCAVSVTHPAVSIVINKTSVTIEKGKSVTLTAFVFPEDADDLTVTWTSSEEAVATVNDGEITGVEKGTAVVTAADAEGHSVQCDVTVIADSAIAAIFADGAVADVCNMQGITVLKDATEADLHRLAPGLYIIGNRKVSIH